MTRPLKPSAAGVLSRLLEGYPDLRPCAHAIEAAATILAEAFVAGHKLLVAGNGGSAADSEHIVGELVKGCTLPRRLDPALFGAIRATGGDDLAARLQRGVPAISLVSQSALVTAIQNDLGADLVFAQQVVGYGAAGDVFWALSTSGNADNLVHALHVARALGIRTITMTGATGGRMGSLSDLAIRVPYTGTQAVQERHLPIYHAICIMVEEELFGE
jgi:D-sedoheptulose 7-phosphate isomerase